MALIDELMASERRLALGSGPEYDATLAEEALVIVPGMVLDRGTCIDAMNASPGWDEVALDDVRLLESGEIATVVYTFTGVRGDDRYRAVLSSTYRLSDGRLLLHQQTPEPSRAGAKA